MVVGFYSVLLLLYINSTSCRLNMSTVLHNMSTVLSTVLHNKKNKLSMFIDTLARKVQKHQTSYRFQCLIERPCAVLIGASIPLTCTEIEHIWRDSTIHSVQLIV